MELTYNKYRIIPVYGKTDEVQRQDILRFWARNRAIGNPAEARRRTRDVVLIIRDEAGEVAGVTSVYVDQFQGQRYYYYRMFIEPGDRVYGMMSFATGATRNLLRDLEVPDKPLGIVAITENVKLMRKGTRRQFERIGWEYVGKTENGLDIWKYDF